MQTEPVPFKPTHGRVLVRQLEYKPSSLIEIVTRDKADHTEGIVCALSPFRHGRKRVKGEWHITADTFPHEISVGDRVIFPGRYQDDDTITLNGQLYRALDSWDIHGIITKDRPDGFTNPVDGTTTSDGHPLLAR